MFLKASAFVFYIHTLLYVNVDCIKNPMVCSCPYIFLPVCGSDGKTYSNICLLECASSNSKGVKVAYDGPCVPDRLALSGRNDLQPRAFSYPLGCLCDKSIEQICGSNGRMYQNACYFECARREECYSRWLEPIYPVDMCNTDYITYVDCGCNDFNFSPVCGSNYKVYASDCHFQCARKKACGRLWLEQRPLYACYQW